MLLPFDSPPAVPDTQRTLGKVAMRYEDIAQDGSLKVGGMPHAIAMVCFRELWSAHPYSHELRAQGIVSILSRVVAAATGGPISVRRAVEVEGRLALAHSVGPDGQVKRVLLNMYADLFGPAGRTHDPQPPNAGERIHVGKVFAEHVFTKPWGPLAERKVLALPLSSGPVVPWEQVPLKSALASLEVPREALWLDPEPRLDAVPLVFGLTHTDSNQHVNSLVYPQLFEDAALRRAHDLGRATAELLVDHIEIAYRKPCFAGQRAAIWVRAFKLGDRLGAVGYLGAEDTTLERAHCMFRLLFRGRSLRA